MKWNDEWMEICVSWLVGWLVGCMSIHKVGYHYYFVIININTYDIYLSCFHSVGGWLGCNHNNNNCYYYYEAILRKRDPESSCSCTS